MKQFVRYDRGGRYECTFMVAFVIVVAVLNVNKSNRCDRDVLCDCCDNSIKKSTNKYSQWLLRQS